MWCWPVTSLHTPLKQADRPLQYQSSAVEVLDFDLKLPAITSNGRRIFSDLTNCDSDAPKAKDLLCIIYHVLGSAMTQVTRWQSLHLPQVLSVLN